MRVIGLTGGIGSGKSTVSTILGKLGAEVIDADAIYHGLIEPVDGGPSDVAAAIGAEFAGVLLADGRLDRKALGAMVFGDPEALVALGNITHPAVAGAVAECIAARAAAGLAQLVYEVPLLYERRLESGMHGVIVVWVPRATQHRRLMDRDGINRTEADKRLASQMPLDEKRARATWVVDNSADLDTTQGQVEAVWAAASSP